MARRRIKFIFLEKANPPAYLMIKEGIGPVGHEAMITSQEPDEYMRGYPAPAEFDIEKTSIFSWDLDRYLSWPGQGRCVLRIWWAATQRDPRKPLADEMEEMFHEFFFVAHLTLHPLGQINQFGIPSAYVPHLAFETQRLAPSERSWIPFRPGLGNLE